jgi:N-methylhydantoinase B
LSTLPNSPDPIRLEVFKHLLAAAAEEMGVLLRKASYSPNIKERRDYSCALFDAYGQMAAQAAHIPVHLGSMPLSVAAAVRAFPNLGPGDMVILNDPFQGGTHLPDITLVTAVFGLTTGGDQVSSSAKRRLIGYAATRAHHADVGGMAAGSMSVASEIFQEGLIIPPIKLIEAGKLNQAAWDLILANVRTPQERAGDLRAQIAANQRGAERLHELALRYGADQLAYYMGELLAYTERMTRRLLQEIPDGQYSFTDYLDDDGLTDGRVRIQVSIHIDGDQAVVDFNGSAPQQKGSINAVYAITLSCVYYVFRSLIGLDVPNNAGCLAPLKVLAPPGSVVNALPPSAVAAGNVETSQRIVDTLLGALAQASPGRIPAASQGTMNNITIGGQKPQPFTYYETTGGGMGARPTSPGPDAIHSHMTNTLNTPVEALEYAYPLRVLRCEIRRGSGGQGAFNGGDGIRRDLQVLVEAQASLLTERRQTQPYGLQGGQPGQSGENILIREGREIHLPGKGTLALQPGDVLSIRTPGGGGHGVRSETDEGKDSKNSGG